ncbi:MAG TPA: hypothetical protein VI160_02570 [Gemmatimonadales bacterium]
MPTHTSFVLALSLTAASFATLAAQQAPDLAPYLMADRDSEVALARSAAPSAVTANATVLVFTRTGFVEAAHGGNGFTCLVMRSFGAAPDDPAFWRPSIRGPMCLNPPAVRTVLPPLLAQVGWALAGATPAQLKAKIAQGYAAKTFPMPAAGALVYMLSPHQHLSDDADPHWMPHLMFYYDRSVTAAALGAGGFTAPVIDAVAGDPSSPVQVIYVPVRTWSDGTPVVRPAPGN